MGKRGPKPKPTAMLKLSGSKWVSETRSGRADEVEVEPGEPRMPSWLKGRKAIYQWKKLVAELMEIGIITTLDGHALARLCMTYVRYVDALEVLAKEGDVFINAKGDPVRSPYSRVVEALNKDLVKLETEFGLTPSSRVRVPATDRKKKDVDRASKESYFG